MTVNDRSASLRRKRRPKGKPSQIQPIAQSDNSHMVQEHSFGKHHDVSKDQVDGRVYASASEETYAAIAAEIKNSDYSYTVGYESQIQSIADAISDELADVYGGPGYPNEDSFSQQGITYPAHEIDDELPPEVHREIQSLLNAAAKVGDVIRHFHSVANRTNLFALKLTANAMKEERGGTELAVQVKDLADETYISAEKIYACMYSIQQTIVNIADNRFDDYKHIPVQKKDFHASQESEGDGNYKALEAISPRTLKSLVEELDKLKQSNRSDSDLHYKELGNFADQLSAEIENLKSQLRAG